MKDMPVFTTEDGVASLTLRDIPYTGKAYIRIQSSCQPLSLVKECADFCRAVGAEEVFAAGDPALEIFPFHTAILRMQCAKQTLGETDAALWPVQVNTLSAWKEIYREKVMKIANAAWMSDQDCREMLDTGEGYFIHRGDVLLGIGRASAEEIRWVASCVPGAGAEVVRALAHVVAGDTVTLEVASGNEKAMNLYTSLGFIPCAEISRWYAVKRDANS